MPLRKDVSFVIKCLNHWEDILGDAKQNYTQIHYRNHDSDINFNINIVENQLRPIVNFHDQHTLEVTEYYEQTQRKKNRDNNEVQFHCGKLCKSDLDLRAHQRFCQISDVPELRELCNKDLLDNSLTEYDDDIGKNTFIPPELNPKVGIKLPKTKEERQTSNDYFKCVLEIA